MGLVSELRRRNVFRVAAAYVVVAWLVVQVAETVFPIYGLSDASIRIVITVVVIGLIPSLILAWAFELTPEGLKKEKDIDRSRLITPQTGKKLDRIIMAVLAVALGYFAFDKFVLSESREATIAEQGRQEGRIEALVESYGDNSIAVLPFHDMSPDKDQEYLSDGIAEELLTLLARIPELRVISHSSAFAFKGKDIEAPEIAERLNVDHILEGSVRKAGNRVRITAQLIEARSDTHLWSETYDRKLDDIFAIQDDIAAAVVENLKVTLLSEVPNVEETDPEAYALFLQASHVGDLGTAERHKQAIALYKQALAIDPDYAASWNGLAANYINQVGIGRRPVDEGYAMAREATEKALAIDPDNALAHAQLGWIVMTYDRDLEAAARHLARALSLDPTNLDVILDSSELMLRLGRLPEAISLRQYIRSRDPVNPNTVNSLGTSYLWAGRVDEAIASMRTVLMLSPGRFRANYRIGEALLHKGEPEAALEAMNNEPMEGFRLIGQAMVYHALGQATDSEAALNQLLEKYEQAAAYNIAYVFAFRDEADRAFAWLNKAVQYKDAGLPNVVVNNLFTNLYDDPRWLPFLDSIGSSPEQLNAIEFDVAVPQ